MSTRTIIEINHDHLDDLRDEVLLETLRRYLSSGGGPVPYLGHIRILGQRHHSETLKLAVK